MLVSFAFASWVFSRWDVPCFVTGFKGWDEDLVSQHDSDFWTVRANMTQYAQFDFQERFYRVNGLIQLIPLMMYFVYLTTKAVLGGVGTALLYMLGCARCVRDEWRADVQYANFSDARDKAPTTDDPDEMAGMLAGLPSYRVQDNPGARLCSPRCQHRAPTRSRRRGVMTETMKPPRVWVGVNTRVARSDRLDVARRSSVYVIFAWRLCGGAVHFTERAREMRHAVALADAHPRAVHAEYSRWSERL